MTNALIAASIMDYGIIPALSAAWPGVTIDEDDTPRTLQNLPLATLSWGDAKVSMDGPNAGVVTTDQAYEFDIEYHFIMPAATGATSNKVSRVKLTLANALIAQLQSGPAIGALPGGGYAANLPLVHSISSIEKSSRFEGAAMMSFKFSCHAQAAHHGTL